MMNRDRQIELLVTAQSRTNERVAAWMDDKDVKAAIRANHRVMQEIKNPPQKRACV